MKYRRLGLTDMDVSYISLGTSALGSMFRPTDLAESVSVVHQALDAGINYIDTAPWYGQGKAETVLGKAFEGVPRDRYYITTKVCRYAPEVDKQFDFRAERTIACVDESLQRMGLDYVDVIQIHDMEFAPSLDIIVNETLPALKKVQDAGKARFIGITGYPLDDFRTVIERSTVTIDTILTYCHLSMNDSSLLQHLDYFKEKNIGVVNASPISMGLLSNRGPPAWHPASQDIKDACAHAVQFCQARSVDVSRLAMHYTYGVPGVATTLVSTASITNLERNLASLEGELSPLENDTLEQVMTKFMKPLGNKTWEGVEVAEYWRKMKALQEEGYSKI